MVDDRHLQECPLCGELGIFWYNDGTHSPRYDIKGGDHLSVCYSYDSDFERKTPDAVLHVYSDERKDPETVSA